METYGIWGDQQIPYHDPRAFSVALQIFSDAKLTGLVYNGDWGDYMNLGAHPPGSRFDIYVGLQKEIDKQRELLKQAQKAIKPRRATFNEGNHEWRLARALQRDTHLAKKVLEIDVIREAISVPAILNLDEHKIKWSGSYPRGCWLRPGLAEHENVYVHHGYTARKKPSQTVSGQLDDHWCSQVVGHCERLAGPIWTRKFGRDFFGVEGGNVSLIGEPSLGDDVYSGIPHSDPRLMNHRQGITIIYYDGGHWWPFTIKIRDGKAVWNGKRYTA